MIRLCLLTVFIFGCSSHGPRTPETPPTSGAVPEIDAFLSRGSSVTHELPQARCTAAFVQRPPRVEAWRAEILTTDGEALLEWEGGVDIAVQVCGPADIARVLVLQVERGAGRVRGEFAGAADPFDLEARSPNPRHLEWRPEVPSEIRRHLLSLGFALRDVRTIGPSDHGVLVPLQVPGDHCASVFVHTDTGDAPHTTDEPAVTVRAGHTQTFDVPAFFQWCSAEPQIEVTSTHGAKLYLWTGARDEVGGQAALRRPLL